MALQPIDIDTPQPNGKRGDPARVMAQKTNANLCDLYGSAGLQNLLINPSMMVNQRVFAGGAIAANGFCYDRWFAGAGGASIAVATNGVINHASGVICQAIESPQNTLGASVAISVGDLSGGNLNVTVAGVAGTITPGVGRRSVNILVPSSTPGGHVVVTLSGAGVTYRDVMVLRTDQAGRFDARPRPIELLMCQRYFETSFGDGVAPGTGKTGHAYQGTGFSAGAVRMTEVAFKVIKRIVPSVTAYTDSLATGQAVGAMALWNGSLYNVATIVGDLNQINASGWAGDMNFGSGIVPGQSYLIRGNWTADAELRG